MDSPDIAWNTALQSDSHGHDLKYEDSRQGHTGNAGIFMNATMSNHPLPHFGGNFDMEFPTNPRGTYQSESMDLQNQGAFSLHNENYHLFDNGRTASSSIGSLMASSYPPSHGAYSGYLFSDPRYVTNINDATGVGELTVERNYSNVGNEILSSQPTTPPSLTETDHNLREISGKGKRQMPYAQLLYKALSEAQDHSMALRDIYTWFEDRTDKTHNKETRGWQNSIRHNLSMNAAFEKTHRSPHREGKHCSVWKLSEASLEHGVKSTTRYRSKTPGSRMKKKSVAHTQGKDNEQGRVCRRSMRIRQSAEQKEGAATDAGLPAGMGSSQALPRELSTFCEPILFSNAAYEGASADMKNRTLIPRSHTGANCFPYEMCGLTHTSSFGTQYNPSEATFSSRGEGLTPADTFADSPFPEPMTPDAMMAPLDSDTATWNTFGDLRNSGWTRIGKSC